MCGGSVGSDDGAVSAALAPGGGQGGLGADPPDFYNFLMKIRRF